MYIATALAWLMLIALSTEPDAAPLAGFLRTAEAVAWDQPLAIPFVLGALMFYVVLYQTRLVPRGCPSGASWGPRCTSSRRSAACSGCRWASSWAPSPSRRWSWRCGSSPRASIPSRCSCLSGSHRHPAAGCPR